MTTKEDVRQWEGRIIYHGTSRQWVEESIRKYGKVQSGHFEGEPNNFQYLSITFDPSEALSYAIKHAHGHNASGSVLIIPFTSIIVERFDTKGWDHLDSPIPYILPQEFSQYIMGRVPADLAQLFGKSDSDLYQMMGDLEDPESINVDELAQQLDLFFAGHIDGLQKKVEELHPDKRFSRGDDDILQYLERNGTLCGGFNRAFGVRR